ncbi:PP2C family protein-serine/threonine phosphatase [Jatrophihabitans fulvus]
MTLPAAGAAPGPAVEAGTGLDALLAEVRALLSADTAVLLVLDDSRSALVPAAWSGLGVRGRASMRIRVGQGFAGTIARTREPLVLSRVSPENVVNPMLLQRGVTSLVGVPLLLEGRLLGVVHVGSLTPRAFTAEDVQLLQRAAGRLAGAVRDERTTEEHTAALVLQRSLLPSVLPQVDGLEFAGRYIPADGDFGGDWYDVFELPDGRVGLVMGDVVGHGLAAAVVMGRLRSALRAYALDYDDPAEVLHRLDRKISHFEPGSFATVLFGVTTAPFGEFVFSSAGHPPPFMTGPDGPAHQVGLPPDPPLAVRSRTPRRATPVRVPERSALCLFTDGLAERRVSRVGDDPYGASIARALSAFTAGDPETVCTQVLDAALGDESAEDDVAVLIARRP